MNFCAVASSFSVHIYHQNIVYFLEAATCSIVDRVEARSFVSNHEAMREFRHEISTRNV
jgi:hypothetical protein